MKKVELSGWINEGHCSMRVIKGADPKVVSNRVAFIEKTARVMVDGTWVSDGVGCGQECGKYKPSRKWCDDRLREFGYKLG